MTTGKTEEDYQLPGDVDIPGFPRIAWHRMMLTEQDVMREREGLKELVVAAAQFWNRAQGEATHVTEVDGMVLTVVRAWNKLRVAVDALESFETKQKRGENVRP